MVAKVLKRLVAMAAFLVYGAHSAAQSPPVPVHYVFAGTFSGSLNGVPFNSNVSVIGNGDANLITGGPTFCNPISSLTFTITNLGVTVTVTDTMSIFSNTTNSAVGFQRGCSGADWIDMFSPAFAAYDLSSSIGPVNATAFSPVGQETVNTTGGTLTLTSGPSFPMFYNGGGGALAPGVTLSASSLAFGSQSVPTSSAPQTITLTNTGTAPLSIASIAVIGDFSESNTCPASLAAADSCTIDVVFTPTVAGSITGTLGITSNAPGSPHTVGLSGTGTAPGISLTPPSLTFASRTVGTTSSPQTITLVNTGNAPLNISSLMVIGDYTLVSNCGASVAAGGSCSIIVTFMPLIAGTRAGSVGIADDAPGSPHTAGLSGVGLPAPAAVAEVSTGILDFPAQPIGFDSAQQLVTVTNGGNAPLTFSAIATTIAGEFTIVPPADAAPAPCPVDLAPTESCLIAVVFHPSGPNLREDVLTIDTNVGTITVRMMGTGLVAEASQLSVPGSLDFGAQAIGTRSEGRGVQLRNTSTNIATITELAASGDFDVSDTCTTIAPGATCTPLVTFRPAAEGTRNGRLVVRTLRDVNPYIVALTGSGLDIRQPALDLSAERLAFGNTFIGGVVSQTITLRNLGLGALQVVSIVATGDFFSNGACVGTIPAGGSCTVTIAFNPGIPGTRTGVMEIVSNDPGGTRDVGLAGVGCFMPTPFHTRLGLVCGF